MKRKELSGIRLIAKELGISTATVSRALSPETSHMVKESRRQQILNLADQMRYRPNPGARLIQRGLNPTLGVLIPEQEGVFFSEFYGRFLGGLIHSINNTKWELRISAFKNGGSNLLKEFQRIGMDCSGLIYAGLPLSEAQVEQLSNYCRPLILLRSVLPPHFPVDQVGCHVLGVDNFNGAATAAKYIAQLGHKRIGIIMGPESSRDFAERAEGYRAGLEEVGIMPQDGMFYWGSYDEESGRMGCEHFLNTKEPSTALICSSDNIAFGALDFAKDRGLNCPKNLSIIGFDDGPWATACSPKLTTVRQPLTVLSSQAIDIIIKSVSDPEGNHAQKVDLPVTLNIRESTAYNRR